VEIVFLFVFSPLCPFGHSAIRNVSRWMMNVIWLLVWRLLGKVVSPHRLAHVNVVIINVASLSCPSERGEQKVYLVFVQKRTIPECINQYSWVQKMFALLIKTNWSLCSLASYSVQSARHCVFCNSSNGTSYWHKGSIVRTIETLSSCPFAPLLYLHDDYVLWFCKTYKVLAVREILQPDHFCSD